MNDALVVGLGQTVGHLRTETGGLLPGDRPLGDLLRQRAATVVGHGDEQTAILGLVDLIDRADVGVVEGRGGPCLAHEALSRLRVPRQLRRQKLERHRALQPKVLGPVDLTHSPATETLQEPVVAEGRRVRLGDLRLELPDRGDQPIALPVYGLDEARLPGVVSQGRSQLPDGLGQHLVGDRDVAPNGFDQAFLGAHLAGMLRQVDQHLHRFGLDPDGALRTLELAQPRPDSPVGKVEIPFQGAKHGRGWTLPSPLRQLPMRIHFI